MNVAIIPARGGSRGLPEKNVKYLCGRPLIAYTVEAALNAGSIAEVYVSTENDEIERIATAEGAKVIRHPPRLSEDTSPTTPVIDWAVKYLDNLGVEIDRVVVMRATSPLRTANDIDQAMGLFNSSSAADSVVSVTASAVHPIRLKRILPDGQLKDAFESEGARPRRRQDFEQLYVRNGAIYAANKSVITPTSLWGAHCLAYMMPPDRGVNINTEFDFLVAELLMARGSSRSLSEMAAKQ